MLLAPMVEIFCDIDDFCKANITTSKKKLLTLDGKKSRNRETQLSDSEIMTILIFFHVSHYRTFKDFYIRCVLEDLASYFPKAVMHVLLR